jgi:hypothetical protein
MGQEFLRKAKATPMPHLQFLVIFLGQDLCVIPTIRKGHKLVGRMTSLSMVSTTSQGDKQPCNRELVCIGLE